MHVEHKDWTFWQEYTVASKFRGKYLVCYPLGSCHLVMHASKSHYTWTKVTTTIHNIIVGKLWIDQVRIVAVSGSQLVFTALVCVVRGFESGEPHHWRTLSCQISCLQLFLQRAAKEGRSHVLMLGIGCDSSVSFRLLGLSWMTVELLTM